MIARPLSLIKKHKNIYIYMNLDSFKIIAQTYLRQLNNEVAPIKRKRIARLTISEQFNGIGLTQNLNQKIAARYGTPYEYIGKGSIIKGLIRTQAIEPTRQKKHNKADKIAAILAAKKKVERIATKGLEVRHILLSDSAKKARINKRIANIQKNKAIFNTLNILSNL